MGDLSAAEERIYEEREDARTIAGGLRKETTPRHERFDGATSIWTEWFSSFNANVLVPYALNKAPPRSAPRADGAGSSEGESTGPEWVFSLADSLQLLQEYVEINAVTRPIIDQWQKDTLRYQQRTLRFDPASGRIRVPSREDADAFHEFRYRRYVELFETKFNEAPKMRTRYDAYTREGFRETPASLAMTLRELKAHLPDLTWDKVNQKAFDVMTSVWRSIPALKQSLDAGFHQLKDIAVLRQSHEDRLDELAAEVERYEDIVRKDEIRMAEALTAAQHFAEQTGASAPAAGGGRQHGTSTPEPVITWTMVNGRRVRAQLVVVKDTHQIRPLCEACTKACGRDIFHGANYRECANKFGSTMYVNDAAGGRGGRGGGRGADRGGRGGHGGGRGDGGAPGGGRGPCWNAGCDGAHNFTECDKPITDPTLIARLKRNQRERERRLAYGQQRGWAMDVETGLSKLEMDLARKAGHMLTGRHDAHVDGAATSSTMADLEAMFSRILQKSQAAHGATGAIRLAVEVPDPFLDCVDTEDHGTLLHGASCVELPVRELREVFFGAPGRAQPVGAYWTPESSVPRPRGRPAVLPPGSARNPELRMRQPGWDAQREQLTKQRPQGFEPAVEQEAPASYEGRRAGGAITSDMLDIRNQQLLQHLRTALQHAKFPGLPVAVVSDMTPEHNAARWLEARNTALRGGLDTRDHMAVAWETVLQQAVRRFEATARLTWVDYTHLDLTRVFAAAVQSVYGLSLPRVSVPPLSLPSAEPQANIHPVDVVQHGVKPLESRRQLSATSLELQQLREVQRNAYPDYPEYDRHSAFYVDCKLTVIVIGGVRILMALLDTGCEYSGVHRRVVDRMKPGEADATLQSMPMQGIGGKMEMQRLVGRISYVINPDTDWERKFEWPSFAILEGDHLPDVILCTSVMAHLGMVIDVGGHTASYRPDPHDLSRHVDVPLKHHNMPKLQVPRRLPHATLAVLASDGPSPGLPRIELQPDNVGADAAVQLEQQDDDAELPELVADSDGEEDFVPCWVEEVPDHVANVIASCFTLRASPMDADSDSDEELPGLVEDSSDDDDVYEELPDLMEDSSDDDDVYEELPDLMEDSSDDDDGYVELTIMTQMEPEVETTLDSEPLAAGACYALRAEGPGADNRQEHNCPSDNEELEDGTAMPLKEHEDEIPGWRELRRQRQAAGRLHLSGHTLERLALVRAVPHSTPELTYIIDLDRTGGKEGRAKQGLFLFAGMLSVLFTNLVDGYHYELIQIVDRMLRSVAHRQRLLRQLEWMHQRWPVQLPRNAFEKCFALSDELEHDVEHITAPAILRHLPELDELRAEPPCQDVSSMGTQHGLRGARTGVIVPLAEAMSELNCMLAKARGVKEYWAAPAQYGYVIENVIPAAPSRRSPEVQEFIDFMARVFGEPNAHHAHKCGDASLRSALWWTNTFTQHYYQAVQHEFERPPRETYAQIVERCSGGLLRAQVATPARPGTMLGGLNVAGRRMIYAPKSVSTPNTRTQRLRPGGAPGSGMVEVVGIDPPQYRPSSAVMREACLLDRDYAGFYTRQELGFSEEEMVIAIGNVFDDHLVNTQELRAAQHELRRSTAAAVEAEMEHAINMATLKQDVFGGAQERPAWATSHVDGVDDKAAADGWSRRSQAALMKCYAAYANEKHLGKESPTVKVTSKLINPKDSKQPHHWAISADWKDKEGFAALMDSDPGWYAWGLDDLRAVDAEPYDFQLVDYNPVFKRQYHLAHREQEWANDWVKKLEKAGIVGEIESPYAAPVIVAPKKDEHGAWTDLRYAVDYRNRLLTFKRMPFGHKNCVAAWQRVVDQALAGLDFAVAFADDVLIFSHDDEQEHMRRVRIVFDRLKARGVQVSPPKTRLGLSRVTFLGHIVSGAGVEPMADKVEAINSLPAPKNVSDVRHFLGMATYYCRFLESFSLVKAPLTALTKKDAPWKWGAAEQQSFDAIKAMLVSAPVLRHPDWRRPFVLHTDWSRAGVGACLSQVDDNGVEYAVSFASRMNTPVEADLSSYEGEVGAGVWAVQRFRYYLYGNHFQLITDCKAMEWLRTTARLRGKLARWSLILAEYDFSIKHRPGKDNTVPDLLSRRPMPAEPVRATSEAAGTATAIATQWRSPAAMADVSAMFGGCSPSKCLGRTPALPSAHAAFATQCIAMAFTAGVYASQELHWPTRDVWSSPVAISYLRGETTPADVSVEVWQQLVRRCAKYSWHNDKVWLHTGDTAREVPKPEERPDAIRRVHASIGHLGRDRTYQVLARHFVWPGMHKDVGAMVKQCRACDRVKASFNQKHDRLKPMPLFGLFYRFSVDSAGPLPTSSEGHKYVIVIVEHFSKWIELVPVRDLEATTTAKAFHERVLARYGAPVEVVTDNGTEYQGAFREQLERHGIQPVDIPPGHPQANGMAERIVQVLKVALRKVVPTLGTASWHSWMPVIEFGYRVSKQATTGYSPYFLLFGRDHVAPDQVRALLEEPVDMDNDIAVINLITQRADMLRAAMPKAFERALQAQQRDVVRYRKVRRGDVQPRRHRFEIGSYVYVAQPPVNTLDVRTARTILRVVEILESGWLRLSGSDGNEIQVHMDNCAPCHLSNLVPARYGRGMPACKGCGSDSIAAPRLICDKCQAMWHVACAKAELHPGEEWLCPDCAPPLRR
eukprot:jgi/Tetstr1/422911/TSEL_013692.t1